MEKICYVFVKKSLGDLWRAYILCSAIILYTYLYRKKNIVKNNNDFIQFFIPLKLYKKICIKLICFICRTLQQSLRNANKPEKWFLNNYTVPQQYINY